MPIAKERNNNLSDSSNFRGTALSPVYGKIYDNIVLYNRHELNSHLSEYCFTVNGKHIALLQSFNISGTLLHRS